MTPVLRTWLFLALTLCYFITAQLALARHSPFITAIATTVLALLILMSIKGRHRALLRVGAAAACAVVVVAMARGAPPVPLMLPPVLIAGGIAWMFGRTLLPGRKPLIERLVRGFYAPVIPAPAIIAYARRVTWVWAVLLSFVAVANAWLVTNLTPDGLIAIAGFAPRWPVSALTFAWFSNIGMYLLIGGTFVAEFGIRVWRFPDYPFRNPVQFIREAKTRMPRIMAALKHG
jgi:hypothetical protein